MRSGDTRFTAARLVRAQDLAAELADILAASDESLRPGMTLETPFQKQSWWGTRTLLDDRLQALLDRLDASWLGPWR